MGIKTGGGAGLPKEKRENKWISRGLKQGRGRANLRKKENEWIIRGSKQGAGQAIHRKREKTNNEKGLKTEGRAGQPKEKRENKWILRPKNREQAGPT